MKNLLANIPEPLPEEAFELLLRGDVFRVERIVSRGHASSDGFWYDQDEHEWVLVLTGEARLLLKGDTTPIVLRSGDFVNIPAHRKHRVEWTTPDEPTVWLAIYYAESATA